jgi:hypothetical protein
VTHWTSKAAPAAAPKPAKIDTKALEQAALFKLFKEHGCYIMAEIMNGEDDNTTIQDLVDEAEDYIQDAYNDADIDKPVKIYRSKLIKYYELWKGPAHDAMIDRKREQLVALGAANIERHLRTLEIGQSLPRGSIARDVVRRFLDCEFDSNVAELDALRDQTKKRIADTNAAIEEMRWGYRREQAYAQLQAMTRAQTEMRLYADEQARILAAMEAEARLEAERRDAMELKGEPETELEAERRGVTEAELDADCPEGSAAELQ